MVTATMADFFAGGGGSGLVVTPLACLACGRAEPCPDCRHHNRIPGWDEPTLPLDEDQEGKQ